MKYILIIHMFLMSSTICIAQKTSSDIRTAITNYASALEVKSYEKALDHYYKKYFQIVPRSEFLLEFKKLDTNDMLSASNKLSKIISISKIVTIDKVQYAFVEYENEVSITYKDNVEEEIILIIKQQIEATENNVSYSEKQKKIVYFRNSHCIVINHNGWKIIPYSKKLAPYIKNIIPATVFKKLKIDNLE